MSRVQDIVAKVDEFARIGKEMTILLNTYDPVHADLIVGV